MSMSVNLMNQNAEAPAHGMILAIIANAPALVTNFGCMNAEAASWGNEGQTRGLSGTAGTVGAMTADESLLDLLTAASQPRDPLEPLHSVAVSWSKKLC